MKHHWQRKRVRAGHIDDWLMTYADVITLLLCLFAVSLALSMPKQNLPPKVEVHTPVIPVASDQTTRPPDYFEGNLPLHGLPLATGPTENPTDETPALPADVSPATLPEIVDHLKTQGGNIEQKGDRITTIQVSSAAFFASGQAMLSEQGKEILQAVAVNLKSDQFRDYQITVEGHTDDSPIATAQFPSNWELSTARAAAVVQFFLQQQIPAQRLRAAGYADTFPILPNRDAGGKPIPENQAQNRRVVIKLEKIEKAE